MVKKIFVLSATYTEASNLVLETLANLTEKKLVIYNCDRKKFHDAAKLHLCITTKAYNSKNLGQLIYIKDIVSKGIDEGKSINILVATKALANALTSSISEEPLAKYLNSLNVNLVTSDSGNTFEKGRINVGTTFNTGVSLDEKNSILIIVTPIYKGADSHKLSSIFMEGAPAIIQAMARLRQSGDLYVFMPKTTTLINGEYISKLPAWITSKYSVNYFDCNEQFDLIEKSYRNRSAALDLLSEYSDTGREYLYEKNFNSYLLEDSQNFLASRFEIFGKQVNPYIIWAAYNNQFANCTLSTINLLKYPTKKVELTSAQLNSEIENLLSENISDLINPLSDKEALRFLQNDIRKPNTLFSFEENEIYVNGQYIKPEHIKYNPIITKTLINKLYQIRTASEGTYNDFDYILYNIKQAEGKGIVQQDSAVNNLIAAYQILGKVIRNFRSKLTPECIIDDVDLDIETTHLPVALNSLRESDFFIQHRIFSFMQTLKFSIIKNGGKPNIRFSEKDRSSDKIKKTIANALLDVLVDFESKVIKQNGKARRVKIFKGMKRYPENGLNLLFDSNKN